MLHFPRFPSLAAFGRRPQCLPQRPHWGRRPKPITFLSVNSSAADDRCCLGSGPRPRVTTTTVTTLVASPGARPIRARSRRRAATPTRLHAASQRLYHESGLLAHELGPCHGWGCRGLFLSTVEADLLATIEFKRRTVASFGLGSPTTRGRTHKNCSSERAANEELSMDAEGIGSRRSPPALFAEAGSE